MKHVSANAARISNEAAIARAKNASEKNAAEKNPLKQLQDEAIRIEQSAGAKMFMGLPDNWYEPHPEYGCNNGHVSHIYIKSEARGHLCPACQQPVAMIPHGFTDKTLAIALAAIASTSAPISAAPQPEMVAPVKMNDAPPEKIGGVDIKLLLRNLDETSYNESSHDLACRLSDCKSVIDALLLATPAAALSPVPEGRKPMPVDPTDEILRAILAVEFPAIYKTQLRNPLNGPRSADDAEKDIARATKQYAAIFSAINGINL